MKHRIAWTADHAHITNIGCPALATVRNPRRLASYSDGRVTVVDYDSPTDAAAHITASVGDLCAHCAHLAGVAMSA